VSDAKVSTDGERCDIVGVLDFSSASSVLDTLTEHLQSKANSTISLAGVTASNSAGLAVLIECLAVAKRAGHTVKFEAIPDGAVMPDTVILHDL